MQKLMRRYEFGRMAKADGTPLQPADIAKQAEGPIAMLKNYLRHPAAVGDRETMIFLSERAAR
jgi:hypothetical protein